MLREFAAIGLSDYITPYKAGLLVHELLAGGYLKSRNVKGHLFRKDGVEHMEVFADMGPFRLVLFGRKRPDGNIAVDQTIPSLREKRAFALRDPEIFEDQNGALFVEGQEANTLETLTLRLTETFRYYREPDLFKQDPMVVSCYGLSTEGKVLLGIERTPEDLRGIKEEESWRRETMDRALSGDMNAQQELSEDDRLADAEVEQRLKKEDMFTVLDAFLYPAGGEDNHFFALGDIRYVDKLMNSYTCEWVYYLELDILGVLYRVLIHPDDLAGEPAIGRRFIGKFRLYGRFDPARLLMEEGNQFY